MIYDKVRIEFTDGTHDHILVEEDMNLQEAVAVFCQGQGLDPRDVTLISIVDSGLFVEDD